MGADIAPGSLIYLPFFDVANLAQFLQLISSLNLGLSHLESTHLMILTPIHGGDH